MPAMILECKPKQVTKGLLGELPDRVRDVLRKRFGLAGNREPMTLEAIGQEYGITRERVRQIENFGVKSIRQSAAFRRAADAFNELAGALETTGAMASEEDFLNQLAKDEETKNHLYFLLTVGEPFQLRKEDDEFADRWTTDQTRAEKVEASLRELHESLEAGDLLPENEIINRFLKVCRLSADDETCRRQALAWLAVSKIVGRNRLGDWGLARSANVRVRGVRDCAYLVMRRHGSPMHFTEVAKRIGEAFGKPAHPATCHNELIKDQRFVLVGRGLYALSDWGYSRGIVREVIRQILKQAGPLAKDEIIKRVLKERYVKPNTILVNLQNQDHFRRTDENKYFAV